MEIYNYWELPSQEEMKDHICEKLNCTCFYVIFDNDTYITLATDYNKIPYDGDRVAIIYQGDVIFKSTTFDDFDKARQFLFDFIHKDGMPSIERTAYF